MLIAEKNCMFAVSDYGRGLMERNSFYVNGMPWGDICNMGDRYRLSRRSRIISSIEDSTAVIRKAI